ncbi:hypothetical protein SARC_04917 [Sphaeroforma arctica JP610]|uniref:Uncharacterized protein n=1 Tax=Sphaeroforma arctica JP610 TaxID=667725 RepID=A0A0L0G110_9EUKA|nr:hypothetical protein SARC_04917 [Sphaeroforma arctica JP610]KNC82812.1 hypothetical protein SARC_04917 [Sphaeroforma arctica JP610]|eukprot:XP_014156714.1 hypothetical protein SARC_04917 [Sphaeroforma arctica JP610]
MSTSVSPCVPELKRDGILVDVLLKGETVVRTSLNNKNGVEGSVRLLSCDSNKQRKRVTRDVVRKVIPETASIHTLCITTDFEIALYQNKRKKKAVLVKQLTTANGGLYQTGALAWTRHEETSLTSTYKVTINNEMSVGTKCTSRINFYFTLAKIDTNYSLLQWLELNAEMSISCLEISLIECRQRCIKPVSRTDSEEPMVSMTSAKSYWRRPSKPNTRRALAVRVPGWS